jgi:hypothetical protein
LLACTFRLLDLGLFRVGGEEYAEENGSFGLSTLRREHVVVHGDGRLTFDLRRQVRDLAADRRRRPGRARRRRLARPPDGAGGPAVRLGRRAPVARRHRGGRQRVRPRAPRRRDGQGLPHLARHGAGRGAPRGALGGRRRRRPDAAERARPAPAVTETMRQVSVYLGNTPAVCRASYVDRGWWSGSARAARSSARSSTRRRRPGPAVRGARPGPARARRPAPPGPEPTGPPGRRMVTSRRA